MKRIICFILVVCILLLPFSFIVASASVSDDLLFWGLEAGWEYLSDYNDQIKNMSGQEFYDWYSGGGGVGSVAWKSLINSIRLEAQRYENGGIATPFSAGAVIGARAYDSSAIAGMSDGWYNAAYVSRDLVESLNDSLVDYSSEFRGTILDDLGLDYSGAIIENCLTVWGSSVITFGVGARDNTGGYVVDTSMGLNGNGFGFYPGSSASPPTFYIDTVRGSSAYLLQDGVRLPNSSLYIVLGSDTLLRVPWFWSGRSCTFHGNGADVSNYDFWYAHYFLNSNTGEYNFGFSGDGPLEIYQHGEKVGEVNNNSGNAWSKYVVADLFNKMRGTVLYFDDSNFEAPETFLPQNIPYDEDDYVVMLVPSDHSSGDTIIYMSPDDYSNYVTEGDIIEGDTINNFDQSTINNINNDYNTIINEIDTEPIINRLDTIIQKLNKIYNAVKNIDISPTYITNQWNSYFNPEPCYESFSDCITTNIPLAADIQTLVNSMNVQTASSGFDTNNNVVLNSSGGSGSNNLDTVQSAYSGLNVSLTWYEPYRQDIRTFFQICCYGFGIVALWHAVKSVFGVHGGGGDV